MLFRFVQRDLWARWHFESGRTREVPMRYFVQAMHRGRLATLTSRCSQLELGVPWQSPRTKATARFEKGGHGECKRETHILSTERSFLSVFV